MVPPSTSHGQEGFQIPGPKMFIVCLLSVLIESFTSSLALCLLPFYVLRVAEKGKGLEGAVEVGAVVGASFVLQILTGPLILRFSSLYGRRIALLATSIASLSSFYILSKPDSLTTLVVARCIGSLSASYVPLSQFYLCDMTPPPLRGQVMMILGGCYAFGAMMGPFAVSTLELSFVSACDIAFFLSTLNFLAIYFLLLESLPPNKLDHSSSIFSFYPQFPSPPSLTIHLAIFLCRFFSGFYLACFEIFAPLLLHFQYGFPPSFSILLLSLFAGLHSIFQSSPLLAFLSKFLAPKTALYVSLALLALSFPFTLSSPPTPSSFLLTVLSLIPFSLCISISQPILSSYLTKSTSPQDAPALTLFFSAITRALSAIVGGVWLSSSTPEETILWSSLIFALSLPFAALMPSLSSLIKKTAQPEA